MVEKESDSDFIPSVEKGVKKGYTRATIVVRKDQMAKIRALAYWERKLVRNVVEEAFENFLKGKNVRSIPQAPGRPYKGS